MKRKVLGVDFDDTIFDTFSVFLAFCNKKYGENFRREQFTSFRYDGVWNITREQGRERFMAFDQSSKGEEIPLLPGARQAILRLAEVHDLHIITSRPIETRHSTHQLVRRNFPKGTFKDIHMCSMSNGAISHLQKNEVCKGIKANIHFEDHPVAVERCAKDGIHVYMLDQQWNREDLPDRHLMAGAIIPVKSWHDPILETLF